MEMMSLFFLHKQSRMVEEVEKATPDVAKIKQLETKLKFKFWLLLLLLSLIVLLLILFLKEHHSSSSSSFLSLVSSRFIYFVIFSKKHDLQYATELSAFQTATGHLFSNKEDCLQRWFMHFKQVLYSYFWSKRNKNLDLPAILFQKIKTSCVRMTKIGNMQAWVVQRMDNAIHRINHYPVDSVVCFVDTYPLDSNLSSR